MRLSAIVAVSALLNSCALFELGKATVQSVNHLMEYSTQINQEYEEAVKTRPTLTFNQFLEEKKTQREGQKGITE